MDESLEKSNLFTKIRSVVRTIPLGKVATYGLIADYLGMKDARKVGWAIYGNQDKTVPCHRVVKKDGGLAEKFSLGGIDLHRQLLENEGIVITANKVDLSKYLYIPEV